MWRHRASSGPSRLTVSTRIRRTQPSGHRTRHRFPCAPGYGSSGTNPAFPMIRSASCGAIVAFVAPSRGSASVKSCEHGSSVNSRTRLGRWHVRHSTAHGLRGVPGYGSSGAYPASLSTSAISGGFGGGTGSGGGAGGISRFLIHSGRFDMASLYRGLGAG